MTPRISGLALALTLTSLLVGSSETHATVITILPSSQDTYVDGSSPNHIYGVGGTANRMFVQPSNGVLNPKIQRALVQFDLSNVPQFSTINSAVLEINEQSGNLAAARTHGVHRANASWAQGSVKWNSQPPANASPTSTQSVGTSRGYKSFTVTTDVQAFINAPVNNHGWLVRDQTETGSTNNDVGYVTREDIPGIHDPETRPKLTIDFTAPSCTSNAQCADSNLCTTNERCQGGFCVVDPVNCNDGNACTDDICDAQQGCLHPLANCDDGFSCTTDSCDPNTLGCTHTPVAAVCAHNGCQTGTCVADQNNNTLDPVTGCQVTSVANDGAACNSDGLECTSDQCLSGECTHPNATFGTACSADGNPCTDDVCDGNGSCHVNNSAPCDDGNGCTQTDQCSGGQCFGSNPVICAPLDACHLAGVCDAQTGLCSNPPAPAGTGCDDGSACTQLDQCNAIGQCIGSNPVVCSALDQCHVAGTCNPGTGVCSNPPAGSGTGCNDGNACTQTDQCNGSGSCVGANPVVCTALDQCHVAGTCNTGTGVCSNPAAGSGTTCNDGNACTQTDQCNGSGSCVGANPVVCTALDQCHVAGTCNTGTGVCSNPAAGSGTTCNDGNACTQTDQCNGSGSCVGANPVVCTALDQCHVAGTCNTGTGVCSNPAAGSGTTCSDGDACTQTDQCNGSGSCIGANPVVCTPLDQCHVAGTCSPGTGVCSNPVAPTGSPCNDTDGCTQTDTCNNSGQCIGTNPVVCTALDQCHDVGTCSPGTGVCSNPPKSSGATCNDNDACTQTDTCNGSGSCIGANPVVCTALDQCHNVGTCSPGTGVCSNPPKSSGATCNDNDACTQTDECNGSGSCVGANPVVCTALNQCHDVGTCSPGTGVCSNPPKSSGATCNDNDACTQTDECNGSGSCVGANPVVCTALDQCHDIGTCSPGTGVCSNPPKSSGATCNDSNACTQTDQCDGSGACVGGNPVVCTALDDCHLVGTCDTQTGVCSNPVANDGTTCSDGNACTLGDTCSGGQCFGNPTTCGNGVVDAGCNEECDDQTPFANCTAQCRFICGPTPQANCRKPVLAKKALLVMKNKTPDKKDVLVWKWVKGAATSLAEFGTPLTTTGYTICVYDASANAQPLLRAIAPPDDTCHGKPCWKATKTGFKYKDKDLTPRGIAFILEKAGGSGGAKLIVKGKGANLGMPSLPLTPTVTVQLKKNDDLGLCWDATFSTPSKNLSDQFKSKAD